MGTDLSRRTRTDAKFSDGFLEAVCAQAGRAPYDRRYVIRGEEHLNAYPDTLQGCLFGTPPLVGDGSCRGVNRCVHRP